MQMEELHQMVCIDQLNQTANKIDFFFPHWLTFRLLKKLKYNLNFT